MLRGNLREINLAIPPQVLQLKVGDTCRVRANFDYVGPAISATLYIAIGNVRAYWPYDFDEILRNSKTISIPDTYPKKTYEHYVDIYISSAISPGRYDLYAKLIGIPGPDIYSSFYENLIEIVEEAAPSPWGSGTYTNVRLIAPDSASAGATVPVTIEIKNKSTSAIHVSAIGVYDSEKRFIDWLDSWIPAGITRSFSGSFVMPANSLTLHAYSYFEGTDGYWHSDCEAEKGITRK